MITVMVCAMNLKSADYLYSKTQAMRMRQRCCGYHISVQRHPNELWENPKGVFHTVSRMIFPLNASSVNIQFQTTALKRKHLFCAVPNHLPVSRHHGWGWICVDFVILSDNAMNTFQKASVVRFSWLVYTCPSNGSHTLFKHITQKQKLTIFYSNIWGEK